MARRNARPEPFSIRDCALVVMASGIAATDARSLREGMLRVDSASLHHHFWGRLLQPQFDEPEFSNDFASWAFHALHDITLAERLSAVDPTDYGSLEDLRSDLVDLIEIRLDDLERPSWTQADEPFHFALSRTIVFDTHETIARPEEMAARLASAGPGTIYFHFIAARRRNEGGGDDFSVWLNRWGPRYAEAVGVLKALDPYFSSLGRLQQEVVAILASLEKNARPTR